MAGIAMVVAFVVTLASMPVVRRMLIRFQMIDQATSRSLHRVTTPRGAGLAELVGIVAGLTSVFLFSWATMVAVVGFGFLGAWDDWESRSARIRLIAQAMVGGVAVSVLAMFDLRDVRSQVALVILGMCLFIVIINAVNFMDGANGMSATHGILFGISYALLSWQADSPSWAILGLCLAAASAAFMPWNFRRTALLFLGDSGSYLLGAIIALLVLVSWAQGVPLLVALAPLSIYLSDVGATLLRRAIQGKPLLQAHREHAYQVLPSRGWDHRKVSFLVLLFSGVCCVLALITQVGIISLGFLALLITLVVMAYFVTVRTLSRH